MIDHVSVGVRSLAAAERFYEAALGALGYEKLVVRPATIGFGKRYAEFWINLRRAVGMPRVNMSAVSTSVSPRSVRMWAAWRPSRNQVIDP